MEIKLETPRFQLREIVLSDENDLFEMDSDPEVHRYIENRPVTSMTEIRDAIQMLQQQYKENGVGRWAVIDKLTNECVGWAGLKLYTEILNKHQNFYELGYRFKRKYWGKGYATEVSEAVLRYGFEKFVPNKIYAMVDTRNVRSIHVLTKLGFKYVETFDDEGCLTDWFELTRTSGISISL